MSDIFPNCKVSNDYEIEYDAEACKKAFGITDREFMENGVSIEKYLALGDRVVLILDGHAIGMYLSETLPFRIGFETENDSYDLRNPYICLPQTKQGTIYISITDIIMESILNNNANPIEDESDIYFQKRGTNNVFFIQPYGTSNDGRTVLSNHYLLRKGEYKERERYNGYNENSTIYTWPAQQNTYRTIEALKFADYLKRYNIKNKQRITLSPEQKKLENYLNANLYKESRIFITDNTLFRVSVTPPKISEAFACRVFKIYKTLFCFRFVRFLFNIYQFQNMETPLLETDSIVQIFNEPSSYEEFSKFLKNGKEFSKFLKNKEIFLLISQ